MCSQGFACKRATRCPLSYPWAGPFTPKGSLPACLALRFFIRCSFHPVWLCILTGEGCSMSLGAVCTALSAHLLSPRFVSLPTCRRSPSPLAPSGTALTAPSSWVSALSCFPSWCSLASSDENQPSQDTFRQMPLLVRAGPASIISGETTACLINLIIVHACCVQAPTPTALCPPT